MAIDLDRCTGCQACVVACKQENNVPFSTPEEAEYGRGISWIKLMTMIEGEYPDVKVRYVPMFCQHCDHPPSVKVCPTGAMFKTSPEMGSTVGHVYARCIGCRYCANACPYQIVYFNWKDPSWPEELKLSFNPDKSIRYKGVVEKCELCDHRLQMARDQAAVEGRELRGEGDYVPACVQSCPTRAMVFGDLDDASTQTAKLSKSPRAFRMLEDLGTEPKIYYLKEGE
jgi:molybdopterin-containing oxidoreductase family iron-sulfur binding subunit